MVLTGRPNSIADWNTPVVRALAASFLFHLLLLLAVETGGRLGWWPQILSFPGSLPRPAATLPQIELEIDVSPPGPEAVLTYIDVSPAQATAETPPEAKFYSALNAQAANPGPLADSNVPEIKGTQDEVVRTVDSTARSTPTTTASEAEPVPPVRESEAQPLQPALLEPKPVAARPEPAPQPRPAEPSVREPGDLAVLKPTPETVPPVAEPVAPPVPEPPPAPPRRRTLDQFLLTSNPAASPGERMRQAGAARRHATEASFDVKSTEFGAYDAAVIAAISKRWYDLLDARYVSPTERGKVVLEFRLTAEGEITHMREMENTVSAELGLICQRAVMEPARYAPWPRSLRALVGKDYRQVKFTFHYR